MKRRKFIGISVSTLAIYAFPSCENNNNNNPTPNPRKLLKDNNLFIPEKVSFIEDNNGVKQYDFTIEEREHNFYSDYKSKTFGMNQSYLGETLFLRDGDKVSINYTNKLNEKTTMHGHGMHVPANMDGAVHQIIQPNESWSAIYTVNQKACTNWNHPHLMGKTAEHVYKGLAALIVVEDDESDELDLPKDYGVNDIPLIVQDRRFDDNYQLIYNPSNSDIMHGFRGDILIVNGQIEPSISVKAGLLRFRILNGSNGSMYKFSFDNNLEFYQIAGDNSFLNKPVKLTSLLLSPSERAEIVIDLKDKKNKQVIFKVYETIDRRNFTVLTINVNNETSKLILPTKLTENEEIDLDKVSEYKIREFILNGSGNMGNPELTINGKTMMKDRIDEKVTLNTTEIWHIENDMGMDHNFHIHATHFRIYKRDGKVDNVSENEKGFKDCVYLPGGSTVDLIVKMIDYSDEDGKYMYHCHFLEHEDAGMMGQFVVLPEDKN